MDHLIKRYLSFERATLRETWRWFVAFSAKNVLIEVLLVISGAVSIGVTSEGDVFELVGKALFGGVVTLGVIVVASFAWSALTSPFRVWNAQRTYIAKLQQTQQRELQFAVDILDVGLGYDANRKSSGYMRVAIRNVGKQQSALINWQACIELANGERIVLRISRLLTSNLYEGAAPTAGDDRQDSKDKLIETLTSDQALSERTMNPVVVGACVIGIVPFYFDVDEKRNDEFVALWDQNKMEQYLANSTIRVACHDVHGGRYEGMTRSIPSVPAPGNG